MARASTVPLQVDDEYISLLEMYNAVKSDFRYKGVVNNESLTFEKFKTIYERVFEPVLTGGRRSGSMEYNYYYRFAPLFELYRGDTPDRFIDFVIQTIISFSQEYDIRHIAGNLLTVDEEAYKKFFERKMTEIAGRTAVRAVMSRPFRLPETIRRGQRRFGHVIAGFREPRVLSPEEREALRPRPAPEPTPAPAPAPAYRPLGRGATRRERAERMGFRPIGRR